MTALLLYACVVLFSVTQSTTTKLYNKTGGGIVCFNAVKSFVALLLFALSLCFFGFTFHGQTLLYGALYGICLTASMYAGYQALKEGPMSLTSTLVSFSVAIPVLYGFCFGKEPLNAFKILGLALLFLAMLFTYTRDGDKKTGKKWLFFVFVAFLSNGLCSVLQKLHQTAYPERYQKEFMCFAMLVCALFFCGVACVRIKPCEFLQTKGKRFAVLSGAANAVANYCTIALAGLENASVLFPAISAGTVILTLLCGIVLFKEKLKTNHWFVLVFGVCAVVFLRL